MASEEDDTFWKPSNFPDQNTIKNLWNDLNRTAQEIPSQFDRSGAILQVRMKYHFLF